MVEEAAMKRTRQSGFPEAQVVPAEDTWSLQPSCGALRAVYDVSQTFQHAPASHFDVSAVHICLYECQPLW